MDARSERCCLTGTWLPWERALSRRYPAGAPSRRLAAQDRAARVVGVGRRRCRSHLSRGASWTCIVIRRSGCALRLGPRLRLLRSGRVIRRHVGRRGRRSIAGAALAPQDRTVVVIDVARSGFWPFPTGSIALDTPGMSQVSCAARALTGRAGTFQLAFSAVRLPASSSRASTLMRSPSGSCRGPPGCRSCPPWSAASAANQTMRKSSA